MRRLAKATASAVIVAACVLLLVLRHRSYLTVDILSYGVPNGAGYMLASGSREISLARFRSMNGAVDDGWRAWSYPNDGRLAWEGVKAFEFIGVRIKLSNTGMCFLAAPHWHLALLIAGLAGLPWVRWRFRLRTLFVTITLLAALLGALAWAAR